MESLIKELQEKAGITEEQSVQVIEILKDYIERQEGEVDWEKFFKNRYESFKSNTKSAFGKMSSKAEDISDKVFDKVEDIATDAKRVVRDASKKVYDKLSEDDK